ncbi:uncharacterized protein LOC126737649 [Anthonomus grandis grandis]|uniref:uncharacterized protein LOC126737649 n=1 Tax=Anthonomus grandis grandis TaxID=2921223 RepID=UPI002166AA64|nr:uncharacterized protein LOC126737649 [Anthonomus grandis grandis]
MVVVDQSKKDLVLTLADDEETEKMEREAQRKKEGRCLAIVVVLFLIGLAVYHGIPNSATSRLSALITAGIILCLYFLWMWYAAHRRKTKQKDQELKLEKHVSSVLENLNNIKTRSSTSTPNSFKDLASRNTNILREFKQKLERPRIFRNFDRGRCKSNIEIATLHSESSSRKSSSDGDIFIRTYSIA